MEKMAAANAEMLARKEGKELVGKKTGGVAATEEFPCGGASCWALPIVALGAMQRTAAPFS